VTVSEDGEEPWSFDPFPVNGGQPFDVELSDLPPFATISLTASVGEDSVTANVATMPDGEPIIDVEMIEVGFDDGMATVTIPADAISGRLSSEVYITIYNYEDDGYGEAEADDLCPDESEATVPASPSDWLAIEVCDWECSEETLLQDGGGP
ncbi:MAG: hypothetical protein GY835_10305, partial [bacterium]|nr:hypothetical protein [bacterium]